MPPSWPTAGSAVGWSPLTCSGISNAGYARCLWWIGACVSKTLLGRRIREVKPPTPHPSGVRPPALPAQTVPNHVAIIMDGNGRWAKQRGLPRTRGHEMGEAALFDVIEGAIELGVRNLSAYAFST